MQETQVVLVVSNQNWDDPRLLKKYGGLFKPKNLRQAKSSWSLPVYSDYIEESQLSELRCTNQVKANTYQYEDEESDGESKKAKRASLHGKAIFSYCNGLRLGCCGP